MAEPGCLFIKLPLRHLRFLFELYYVAISIDRDSLITTILIWPG